jgi:hypothetical protein
MKIRRIVVALALAGFGLACRTKAQSTPDKAQATDSAALDSLDAGASGGAPAAATAVFPGGQTNSQSGGFFSNWLSMVGEPRASSRTGGPRWRRRRLA